jgi:hypothetical protein
MTIKYKNYPHHAAIRIRDHAMKTNHNIERVDPETARRSLGVFLAPSGTAAEQLNISTMKARKFSGKLNKCSISLNDRWIAARSVIIPSVTSPLVNAYFTDKDIWPLESTLSSLHCSALGLNHHFPRAILHGSTLLGGLGIPTAKHKATKERINYFFLISVARPRFKKKSQPPSFLPRWSSDCSHNFFPQIFNYMDT